MHLIPEVYLIQKKASLYTQLSAALQPLAHHTLMGRFAAFGLTTQLWATLRPISGI